MTTFFTKRTICTASPVSPNMVYCVSTNVTTSFTYFSFFTYVFLFNRSVIIVNT